jgi:hypothetical protein
MSEAISNGFITVRRAGTRVKSTEEIQRFSTRRLREETEQDNAVVTVKCVETIKVLHARRNPGRGHGSMDRWFGTVQDAGYILGTEWCRPIDFTNQINRAIAFNRNGEVGNYKYKWEWVLSAECYVETKPKPIEESPMTDQ